MEACVSGGIGSNSRLEITEDLFYAGQTIFDMINFSFTKDVRMAPRSSTHQSTYY
jgi:hypothetical protein